MLNFIKNVWPWGGVSKTPTNVEQNSTLHTKLESKVNDHVTSSLLDSFVMVPDADLPKSAGFLTKKFYNQVHDEGKKPSNPEGVCKAMTDVGGTSMSLKTTEGHMVKAIHFNLDNVMTKLKESGAQKATFSTGNENIPAFVFDNKNPAQATCLQNLNNLGFLSEGVWKPVKVESETYLFSQDNFRKFEDSEGAIVRGAERVLNPSITKSVEPISIDNSNRKTVVVHGGIYSYANSMVAAQEAAKYLSLGFNVLVSEDKHDKLDNAEAHTNVMANRAAIYQELKSRKVANEDIVWAGTCFSSGAAVESAVKYPGSHVIINQGYNDIKEVVNDTSPYVPSFLVNQACKNFDFDYKVGSNLKDVKGNLVVIGNKNDSPTYQLQFDKIKKAAENVESLKGKRQYVEIDNPLVKHAGHWFKSKTACKEMENHLQGFGLSRVIS